jgi:hypothetical protein
MKGREARLIAVVAAGWVRRAAENGRAAAQAWMRRNGYTGPMPPPVDWAAMMVPTLRHAAGHTRVCGTPIS